MAEKRRFAVPDMYVPGIRDLDPEKLKEKGIRLLLVDYDNTLMESTDAGKTHDSMKALERLRDSGIIPVILSNNFASHCHDYAVTCGVDYRSFSMKQLPFTYREVMKTYGCTPAETAAIGDQLLTDMLGAYLAGIYRILSDPLSEKDNLSGTVSRWMENRIFARWKQTRNIQRGNYYDHL